MRVVVSSLLGLSLICSTAWAVETAPVAAAPAAQATTATPPPQTQKPQTLPANKPATLPAGTASMNPNGLPQEAMPLPPSLPAKNKEKKETKNKT